MRKNLWFLAVLICISISVAAIAESTNILIKSIKLNQNKAVVMLSQTLQIEAIIAPANAAQQDIEWTSSDEAIATVSGTGLVTPKMPGVVTITGSSTDGSQKTAACVVQIPTISVESTNIVIKSTEGVKIPVDFSGSDLRAVSKSTIFMFDSSIRAVYIWPTDEGQGTIVLSDINNPKQNTITLNVTVDSSAVFDNSSYPSRDAGAMVYYINDYLGEKIGISGKIIHMQKFWQEGDGERDYGYRHLLVADSTVQRDRGSSFLKYYIVKVKSTDISARFKNGDYVEVFGTIQRGISNTLEKFKSYILEQDAEFYQRLNYITEEIDLDASEHPELNSSFYYINSDWCCYTK